MNKGSQPAEMRRSNLELFRIVSMLFIVAHHYVFHGGLTGAGPVVEDPLSFHSQLILLFGAWGKIGINCFVLITGYFMCEKQITLKKFLKLLFEILFYKTLAVLIFGLEGQERLSFVEVVKYLLPVRDLSTDFYGGYLVFFLFIPFLNVLVRQMNEKTHVRLLALLSFAFVFLGTFPGFSVTLNNAVWFMALYIIASYIRLYPKKIFENKRFWCIATLVCVLLSAMSVIVCSRLVGPMGKPVTSAWGFVMDSNTLLAVLTGLSAFMLFRILDVPQSRIINTIASTTFGVLLIHSNGTAMRIWLWNDLLHTVESNATLWGGILHGVLSVIGVFAAASLIDLVRIRLIEKPFFRMMDKVLPGIEAWWKRLEEKFFRKCHIGEK